MSTGAALPPSSSNAALQQQALFARVASLERKVWGEDGCAQEAQKKMSLSEAVRKAKASLESLESSCEDLRGIRSLGTLSAIVGYCVIEKPIRIASAWL
jgi:hypothetical protein